MRNLIDSENGVNQHGLGSFEKQLARVKQYLIKAVEKLLKSKSTTEQKKIFEYNKQRIESAQSSEVLLAVVDGLFDTIIGDK